MNDAVKSLCSQCGADLPTVADPTQRYVACSQCGLKNDLASLVTSMDTLAGGAVSPPSYTQTREPAQADLTGRSLGGGRFTLDARIGRGGMGAVYRGTQVRLRRTVAVKILSPDLLRDNMFIERFRREAVTLGTFEHPNIVNVIDTDSEGDLHYIVMHFVAGPDGRPRSLKDLIDDGKMPLADVLRVVTQCCAGLDYAHNKKIIHRDVKPGNVLIDSQGNALLADFGIASSRHTPGETTLTLASDSMGTPDYMSPEQRTSPTRVDARADLYSLGVMFYEMLTGVLPRGDKYPPASRIRGDVDKRIDEIIARALQKDPARRYQSAAEMGQAVMPLLEAANRKNKVVRPRRARMAATAAAILLAVAAALFFLRGSSHPTINTLLDAVNNKTTADVVAVLDRTPGLVRDRDAKGRTALHYAAHEGKLDVVEQLLLRHADCDATDDAGRSPLHDAAENGNDQIVFKLLSAGANPEARDKDGKTPLALAEQHPWPDVVYMLGQDAFIKAVRAKDYPKAEALLKVSPKLATYKDGLGDTLLHGSAREGELELSNLLLKYGAAKDATDAVGRTPLMLAAGNSQTSVAELLLDKGANPSLADSHLRTALHDAAKAGDVELVNKLLAAAPGLRTVVDADGKTAAQLASAEGKWQVATLLDPTTVAPRGPSGPGAAVSAGDVSVINLCKAVRIGDDNRVNALLAAQPNLSQGRLSDNSTPLHIAAEHARVQAIDKLVQAGADINAVNDEGRSALHTAAAFGQRESVSTLLGLGANRNLTDHNGLSPREVALQLGASSEILVMLGGAPIASASPGIPPLTPQSQLNPRPSGMAPAAPTNNPNYGRFNPNYGQAPGSQPPGPVAPAPRNNPGAWDPNAIPNANWRAPYPPVQPVAPAAPAVSPAMKAAIDFATAFKPANNTYMATIDGKSVQITFHGNAQPPYEFRIPTTNSTATGVCVPARDGTMRLILHNRVNPLPEPAGGVANLVLPLKDGGDGSDGFVWVFGDQRMTFTARD